MFCHGSAPSCLSPRLTRERSRVRDRKSTRLNSSHLVISYAVFCLKKKRTRAFYPSFPATPSLRPAPSSSTSYPSFPLPFTAPLSHASSSPCLPLRPSQTPHSSLTA